MAGGQARDREVGDPDRQLVADDDDVAGRRSGPGIRHRLLHALDDLRVRLAPAGDLGPARGAASSSGFSERAAHALALEDVRRLDDALVDHRLDAEQLGERLRRLARALQRRGDESADRAAEAVHVLRRLPRHPAAVGAQPVAREPPVEHAAGVVDLSVAHEMKAVGGHPPSLRGATWSGRDLGARGR